MIGQAVAEFEFTLTFANAPIDQFARGRRDAMTDADFAKTGTHPEHGQYGVARWLEIYAEHAHNHADQIRRARASAT